MSLLPPLERHPACIVGSYEHVPLQGLVVFPPGFRFWIGRVWARRPATLHATLHASVESVGRIAFVKCCWLV